MATSRRAILKTSITLAIAGVFGRPSNAQILREPWIYNGSREPLEKSPHCEALALVFETQRYAIRDIETRLVVEQEGGRQKPDEEPEGDWWFDTDERRWTVRRPCPPGTIDSTHSFCVSYFKNDVEVGRWYVNTEKRTVDEDLEFLAAEK